MAIIIEAKLGGAPVLPTDPTAATWLKIPVGEAAFTAAATTEAIALTILPAGVVIHKTVVKHSASFTGGSLTAFAVAVGYSGSPVAFAPSVDVFAAPGDTVFTATSVADTEMVQDFGAPLTVEIEATSTTDDVVAATAGALEVFLLVSLLPL